MVISNTVMGAPPLTRSHSSSVGAQVLVAHEHAFAGGAKPKALVEAHQMRRGIDMHALARRFQDRAQEGDGRALAVGAGDVDHRRQFLLRMTRARQQPLDAVERQVDPLGMQRGEPRDDRVNRRRHGGALTRAPEPADCGSAPARRRLGQQPAQFGKRRAQLVPVHHHVDHAVLDQIFGALEAFRQFLADGLLDDARAGEADQRAGLGDLHVAQHGVGGGDAAGGRIGEHDDVGLLRLAQHLHRDRGARHLHQREDAFLHARAAGGREHDERRRLLHRGFQALRSPPRPPPCRASRP